MALIPILPATLIGVAFTRIDVGGSNPLLLTYLGNISPADDIGKLEGVHNVFGNLGSTLGTLITLPLVASTGFRIEYLACVGLVILVGILAARMLYGDSSTVASSVVRSDDD